jgi:hypothetical protein
MIAMPAYKRQAGGVVVVVALNDIQAHRALFLLFFLLFYFHLAASPKTIAAKAPAAAVTFY